MRQTVVFKEEFETKLKKLKIKTRFVKAVKSHCKTFGMYFDKIIETLNSCSQWSEFISSAFIWAFEEDKESDLNHEFWKRVSKM